MKANNSDDKPDFNDYNIITPLRFLLMKQKHPKEYAKLASLVSNIESKVRKIILMFRKGKDFEKVFFDGNIRVQFSFLF